VFLLMSVVSFAGLVWATIARVHGVALFWWIMAYPLPYYITYPQARYRHAIEPEMLLVAGFAVAAALRRTRHRPSVRAANASK
jgi:hypothetical protein